MHAYVVIFNDTHLRIAIFRNSVKKKYLFNFIRLKKLNANLLLRHNNSEIEYLQCIAVYINYINDRAQTEYFGGTERLLVSR